MRGLFVTGTDTGVGKSVLSAALIAAMVAAGESVRAYKPVVTGLDELAHADNHAHAGAAAVWPPDHELLGSVAGMAPQDVSPLRFGPAVSPHLAAQLAGRTIDPQALVAAASAGTATPDQVAVVEGVGGLLVPLADDYTVRDLAVALGLPLVIAARPGLGTINHTLLTVEAARAVGLHVCAVVLTPWPQGPSAMERSNRDTIARLGGVAVHALAAVSSPQPRPLAAAGAALPWRKWLIAPTP